MNPNMCGSVGYRILHSTLSFAMLLILFVLSMAGHTLSRPFKFDIPLSEVPTVVYTRATENLESSTEDVGYWDSSRYETTPVSATLSDNLEDGLLRIVPDLDEFDLASTLAPLYLSSSTSLYTDDYFCNCTENYTGLVPSLLSGNDDLWDLLNVLWSHLNSPEAYAAAAMLSKSCYFVQRLLCVCSFCASL